MDTLLTIEEPWIARAVKEVALCAKIVAEPSACVGIAAALAGKIDTSAGRRLCFIITGGNVDAGFLCRSFAQLGGIIYETSFTSDHRRHHCSASR